MRRLFADAHYLEEWPSDLQLGALNPHSPVTRISWFAATAYCRQKTSPYQQLISGNLPFMITATLIDAEGLIVEQQIDVNHEAKPLVDKAFKLLNK